MLRPNGLWVLLGLIVVMALLPLVASPYVLLLMLPFIGYGIALLGFNLLFGSTGLLSFGHALFLGVGAYTAAALTSKFGILSFELLLLTAATGVRADLAGGRRALRSLHQNILRHADAGVRHAVSLLPVQILQHHRRRPGHAGAASAVARHGMARRQDRVSDRAVLLLRARAVCAAGAGDVAHHPIAIRPASARHPRERRQGRLCRRARFFGCGSPPS